MIAKFSLHVTSLRQHFVRHALLRTIRRYSSAGSSPISSQFGMDESRTRGKILWTMILAFSLVKASSIVPHWFLRHSIFSSPKNKFASTHAAKKPSFAANSGSSAELQHPTSWCWHRFCRMSPLTKVKTLFLVSKRVEWSGLTRNDSPSETQPSTFLLRRTAASITRVVCKSHRGSGGVWWISSSSKTNARNFTKIASRCVVKLHVNWTAWMSPMMSSSFVAVATTRCALCAAHTPVE